MGVTELAIMGPVSQKYLASLARQERAKPKHLLRWLEICISDWSVIRTSVKFRIKTGL